MIEKIITAEQLKRAENLYSFKKLKGSIMKGSSNIYGALGEVAIYDFFVEKGFDIDFRSTYDYDMVIDKYKVDVKTKRTTVKPKESYLCSIAAFNIRQDCDLYFFVRVNENKENCFLLGYKRKEDFFKEAVFNRKGDIDVNGWAFKDDCYNLEIGKLKNFKTD